MGCTDTQKATFNSGTNSNKGLIPNASLVVESNRRTEDYHHEINFENDTKWLIDKFIPNLVLVINNASYDNIAPHNQTENL